MDSIAHAYLFIGPEQIGKKKAALELFSDRQDVSLVTDHGIDAIREAKAFLSLRSFSGGKRAVIIDDAHKMTEEAQNALLKVLEEPSPSGMLILVTAHPDALLETIVSRCETKEFRVASRDVFRESLKENKLKPDQLSFLYEFTDGAIGLAKSLLKDDLKELKSTASEFGAFLKMKLHERFSKTKELADSENLRTKELYWMRYVRASRPTDRALRPLMELYATLQQPQFGRQLALERFMIELNG